MKKTRSLEIMGDRYRYDFKLCSYEKGWAQVDTRQDASYFGTWCHPTTFELMSYCEGDVTHTQCDNESEFVAKVRELADWNKERGYWLGIDAGFADGDMRPRFIQLGLEDLMH
jgi:hypothetical protein